MIQQLTPTASTKRIADIIKQQASLIPDLVEEAQLEQQNAIRQQHTHTDNSESTSFPPLMVGLTCRLASMQPF